MTARKVPMRQCVGCQEQKPKRSMVRIVLTPTEEILIDPTGKKSGRGAYICPKESCLEMAKKRKSLERGLKSGVSSSVYDNLRAMLREIGQDE